MSTLSIPPAQLWIGPDSGCSQEVETYLQKTLCSNNGCAVCTTCMHVRNQQHHAALWLRPEKQYTLEQLNPIFKTIAYELDPDQQFFFIISKADCLPTACANSLLKSIEEPPRGYHFILVAERPDAVLPTIRSRCLIKTIQSDAIAHTHTDLFNALCTTRFVDPSSFLQIIDKSKINERESIQLLDRLFDHWITRYKQAITDDIDDATLSTQNVIRHLEHAIKRPPMQGSSKLFWKQLFLCIKN